MLWVTGRIKLNSRGQHLKAASQGIFLSFFSNILEIFQSQSLDHGMTGKAPSKYHKGFGVFTFQTLESLPARSKLLISAENLAVPGGF